MFERELPAGRFQSIQLLARGSEGYVYKAYDKQWWTYVILKRFDSAYWEENFEYRLAKQIEALHRLDHPGIVRYFEYFTTNYKRATWLVYEYYPGELLIERLERNPRGLPIDKALRIFKQILEGIAYAHEKGVIHRDLKATNIVLRDKDDSAVIIDFGLATTMGERSGTMDVSAGTPYYMSPEQFESLKKTDERTDIWALGCLLQQLLSNTLPFGSPPDDTMIVMSRVLSKEPNIPYKIPNELARIIRKALVKDMDKRLGSAKEFLRLIEEYESF